MHTRVPLRHDKDCVRIKDRNPIHTAEIQTLTAQVTEK